MTDDAVGTDRDISGWAPPAADSWRAALIAAGVGDRDLTVLPTSAGRFRDGAAYRVEIPSVEGPEAMAVVLAAAARHNIRIDRVSQGSGLQMLTDAEITEMLELGRANGVEVCLFTSLRAGWGTGVQVTATSGRVLAGALRGSDELAYAIAEVTRACELGVRSVLVADTGLLWALGHLRSLGHLPADLILKVSISLPVANAATARVLADLGADTLNVASDLTLPMLAAIRAAVDQPLDLYIESADDFGGAMRYHEIAEIVRVAAPVHLKFTVRNGPGTYPSGAHLQAAVNTLSAERVRRAAIGLGILHRAAGTTPAPRAE